jgi:hypothetical protein
MSSVAARVPTRSVELRPLSPDEASRARSKARAYNSPPEQELFLAAGGTLADWYAQAAAPPLDTEQERRKSRLARLIRLMPDGLTSAEQTAWIATAEATL